MSMRSLIVTENITADGVIDMSGGWFDPQGPACPDMADAERRHRAAADAVLLGRRTYEAFAGFWPAQQDDTTGVAGYLNRTAKYVASSTLTDPSWQHTTVLRGDLATGVRALKDRPGGDIVATGSVSLVHALIRAGLVDEYRLFVYPVVVGRGARLFEDGAAARLVPEQAQLFTNGVTLLRYRVG
jgi:dihydrofolate reductase